MLIARRVLRRRFNFFGEMEPLGYSGEVKLTALEEKLFAVFRLAAKKSGKPVVLRVAGGWVRDKVACVLSRSSAARTTTSTSRWTA